MTPTKIFYRWQRCTAIGCTPINGATTLTLKLTRTEVGHSVRFVTIAAIAGKTITSGSRKLLIHK